jgi:P27 family predicted phage terminase small subunit
MNRPVPTALKKLRGNPGKRPMNPAEPTPSGIAKCPASLGKAARKIWVRESKHLVACGLLTSVDASAFAVYCTVKGRLEYAETQVEKYGMVVKDPSSSPDNPRSMPNPYLSIADKAIDQLRKFAIEFGLTPASRSRLQITAAPEAPASEWDEFDNLKVMPSATATQ